MIAVNCADTAPADTDLRVAMHRGPRDAKIAAATIIIRAVRRWLRLRPNNKTDPFTLEELDLNCSNGQLLFKQVQYGGNSTGACLVTAVNAELLAEYGLSRGRLLNPLTRALLNPCEVLRLEHMLVNSGRKQYESLAAKVASAAEQKFDVPDFSCLDHSLFLEEIRTILPPAQRLRDKCSMRDRRDITGFGRSTGIDTLSLDRICRRLVDTQVMLESGVHFDPRDMLTQLTDLSSTFQLIRQSIQDKMPCQPSTWPDIAIRDAALAQMASNSTDDSNECSLLAEGDGGSSPVEHVLDFGVMLAASSAKKQSKQQAKEKKRRKKKKK